MSPMPLRSIVARSMPMPMARPECPSRRGSTRGCARPHSSSSTHSPPASTSTSRPCLRVGMARRDRAPARAGQQRADTAIDLSSVRPRSPIGRVPAPQIELVRLADVQAVDDVAAVDEPRRAHEHVVGGSRRQLAQGRRDRRRGLAAQQRRAEIARVAARAPGRRGRRAERVVVVGHGDDAAGAVHEHRAAPARAQGIGGARDELLHAMRAVSGVGEVGQGQGPAQLVLREVRHGTLLLADGGRGGRRPGRSAMELQRTRASPRRDGRGEAKSRCATRCM